MLVTQVSPLSSNSVFLYSALWLCTNYISQMPLRWLPVKFCSQETWRELGKQEEVRRKSETLEKGSPSPCLLSVPVTGPPQWPSQPRAAASRSLRVARTSGRPPGGHLHQDRAFPLAPEVPTTSSSSLSVAYHVVSKRSNVRRLRPCPSLSR